MLQFPQVITTLFVCLFVCVAIVQSCRRNRQAAGQAHQVRGGCAGMSGRCGFRRLPRCRNRMLAATFRFHIA